MADHGALTLGRGRGIGYMCKGGLEVNAPKQKKVALVLDKEVNKYNGLLKFKLKAHEHVSPEAHLLLNLTKGAKEIRIECILDEIRKGPREGSSVVPDSLVHNDSSDNFIWESSDDDKTESDNDSDKGDNVDDYNKDFDTKED
ncbi:hypothetical protein Tco_1516368 [Tanacetum coccineum]